LLGLLDASRFLLHTKPAGDKQIQPELQASLCETEHAGQWKFPVKALK
jgi:hypothetical protein